MTLCMLVNYVADFIYFSMCLSILVQYSIPFTCLLKKGKAIEDIEDKALFEWFIL